MHILLYTSASNKSGGARQALYLAQGMAERGHCVRFFVPEHSSLPSLAPKESFWGYLGKKNGWRKTLEAAMPAKGAPCVVHAFHNAAVKKAAWWGLFWRKRAAIVAHRGVLFRPNNPLPYWSPGIDSFLVNSQECGRVLQRVGLSKKRIDYVPNSVPDERVVPLIQREKMREEYGILPQDFVFITVGNNSPVKGFAELIAAFAQAFSANVTLHLLIVGANKDRWTPLCNDLGVGRQVHLVPETEDVASYMAAADVFVLPSHSESMPNTLLEAVRMGLPSLGTTVGAVADIIADCGLLVAPKDVFALAESMRTLFTDAALRTRLCEAARRESQKYEPARRLDLVESIYRRILRQKGFTV